MAARDWDGTIHASEIHAFDGACKRRYWFRYSGTEPAEERANLALGTAIHGIHEVYLETGEVRIPTETIKVDYRVDGEERFEIYPPERQVALAQLSWPHLPQPGEGYTEVPYHFEFRGISFAGTIDYIQMSERRVIDHKTTSNLRWAKTTKDLQDDPQPILYGWAALQFYGPGPIAFLWSYTQTRGKQAWRGVDFSLMSQELEAGMFRMHAKAEQILEFHSRNPDPLELSPEPSECQAYGRQCPYRVKCADVSDLQIALASKLVRKKD